MRIGTVKEIKRHEYRVGLTPACVASYVAHGHDVWVEAGAGIAAGFEDAEYTHAGATLVTHRDLVFEACDMVVKVKEPLEEEYRLLREGQILYTYLHLAANEELTRALINRKIKAVAYETIEGPDGQLPCLKPMSEIAGRLSIQEGAKYLEKPFGGRGVLLGGVPGVKRGHVAIIGGGIVGINACKMAVGCGANVTLLDISPRRLEYIDDLFGSKVTTLYSTETNIEWAVTEADVVVGAVLLPGRKAPKLVKRDHLKRMKRGAVVVDVAVDQGGCFETTRPTTHDDPVYTVEEVVHYCVANMPGAVALTSTLALTSTTLVYGLQIADDGLESACRQNPGVMAGLNTFEGQCVHEGVASSLHLDYVPATTLLR